MVLGVLLNLDHEYIAVPSLSSVTMNDEVGGDSGGSFRGLPVCNASEALLQPRFAEARQFV
jgi:hypothetical protein